MTQDVPLCVLKPYSSPSSSSNKATEYSLRVSAEGSNRRRSREVSSSVALSSICISLFSQLEPQHFDLSVMRCAQIPSLSPREPRLVMLQAEGYMRSVMRTTVQKFILSAVFCQRRSSIVHSKPDLCSTLNGQWHHIPSGASKQLPQR